MTINNSSARIKMNSKSLQTVFSDVYRNYFANYDLVMSGCFSLHWAQEGAMHESKGIIIKTKLPLKCYVCISINTLSDDVIFDDCKIYDIGSKNFETISYEQINKEYAHTKKMVKEFLMNNGFEKGIRIGFISEVPRGHSLGFSDTSSAILATSLFLLTKRLKRVDFSNYDTFVNSPVYKEILLFAWKLSFVPRYGNTIAQAIYATMINKSGILVTYCEDFSDKTGDVDVLNDIAYDHYHLLDRINDSIITTEFPFEYGLIYSGVPSDSRLVEQYKRADARELEKYKGYIKNTLISEELMKKNVYCKKFIDNTPIITYASDLITILNIRSIYLINQLLERGYTKDLVLQFIDNINSQRAVLSMITGINPFSNDLLFYFKKNQSHPDEDIGVTPLYSGKLGGGCFFVMQPQISRGTLDRAIDEMRRSYPNIELEYCSYMDGDCSDGIILEQHISQGIFGRFIQNDYCLFSDSEGIRYTGEYASIVDREKEGIILDKISGKIYVNGHKLTSKDLPSQSTTIEVLSLLMDSDSKKITNQQLPTSSYSKNKNEIIGKILSPLIATIENLTGKRLDLLCHGGLVDYSIQLEKCSIRIGVISKII